MAAVLGSLLAACPGPENQVEHSAELESLPDVDCVWQQLMSLARVPKVITARDELAIGVSHRFHFDTELASHSIGLLIKSDGGGTYRNAAWGRDMKADSLRAAKRSALDIDAALSGHCGLGDLPNSVAEACYGKHCAVLLAD